MFRDTLLNKDWASMVPRECQCGPAEGLSRIKDLQDRIRQTVAFEISNVAEYLYVGTPQEVWDTFSDFPSPRPPFTRTWMEWSLPKTTSSEGEIKDLELSGVFKKAGCLIEVLDPSHADFEARGLLDQLHLKASICMCIFGERADGLPFIVSAQIFGLNEQWQPVGTDPARPDKISFAFLDSRSPIAPQFVEFMSGLGEFGNTVSFPALLAMSLLNCKNIATRRVDAPPALIKANIKRGKEVTPSHLIIEIRPITERIQRMSGGTGYSKAAASIVRGHFKDYSQGKGLFGRYKGMFWWAQRLTVAPENAEYRLKNAVGALDRHWIATNEPK